MFNRKVQRYSRRANSENGLIIRRAFNALVFILSPIVLFVRFILFGYKRKPKQEEEKPRKYKTIRYRADGEDTFLRARRIKPKK